MIVLYGEKRVGKDTAADIIQKHYPFLKRKAFANIPKDILCKTLGISKSQFENDKETFRPYLINFAETMKQYFGKDIWAKLTLQNENPDNLLITDLRFKEEYDFIKQFNPIIIKIVNKNIKETNIHQLPYDYLIDNTEQDITLLENKVKELLERIL